MLEVIEPGLLTTVQDAGRPDWTHLGVPIGGAGDGWSLAVANLLAGNAPGIGAVEMTLVGATFAVRAPITIGLAGADLGGIVRESGRPLPPGRTHRLDRGTTIAFGGDASSRAGARAYLAVRGGIDVPLVLGSTSTALGPGFGGVDGRLLQPGDILRPAAAIPGTHGIDGPARSDSVWPTLTDDPLAEAARDAPIRILPGPASGVEAIVAAEWRVGAGSDRVGLRIEGPPIAAGEALAGRELLSHGVVLGAIQIPAGGAPIVLLADHQTTGGYPIAAVVITADHPRLGQLRPGAEVRFVATTIEDARAALTRQREALAHGAAALREVAGWDDLWQSAGG
jgi:antagonist of KipI